MLGSIRKFSSSIYAKIFLFIVAIPFVFWGMGPLFTGGNLNVIVQIGKKKVSTQEFADYLNYRATDEEITNISSIEKFLSSFIGDKLINEEIEDFNIKLSDNSLSSIIKNEETFKKDKKFSRTKYEKFLVENNLSAVALESNIAAQYKKEQLLDFIGGGIVPANFLINLNYDKINQSRNIQAINLNKIIKKKITFTNQEVEEYYEKNKDDYKDIKKSIKFIKLNPEILTNSQEFDDLFYEKIDEIDDLIVEGKSLDFILNEYNLGIGSSAAINKSDALKNLKKIEGIPAKLIKNIFNNDDIEPVTLFESMNEYFVIEVIKTEDIQRKITEESVKKNISLNLENITKRKFISQIISRINKNDFKKIDFDELSKKENAEIIKVKIENQNDDKILKKQIIKQIYAFSEKSVVVVADINFAESYLVYVDKINNKSISKNPDDYNKYFDLSKEKLVNSLYNTYDSYLRNKYEININYKALDSLSR